MSKTAAIILAAGVSSRMGQFKPLLQVDGESMICRVVRSMAEAGADPILVVTGYRHRILMDHLSQADLPCTLTFVHNEGYYSTQMLDSLLLGASHLEGDVERVLVTPADVPLVERSTVRALLDTPGDFVRPTYQDKAGHPVVMSPWALEQIRAFPQHPEGLRGAIEACGIAPVDVAVEDMGTTLDGDTRDEYARLLKYQRQRTSTPQPILLDLRLGLQAETLFWGPDCAQFLEMIQTTGSMLNACQCMHISYSRGWKMINEMERQLGYPVLLRAQGGINGGGSDLTEAGARFLRAFLAMQEEIQRAGQEIFSRYFPNGRLGEEDDS